MVATAMLIVSACRTDCPDSTPPGFVHVAEAIPDAIWKSATTPPAISSGIASPDFLNVVGGIDAVGQNCNNIHDRKIPFIVIPRPSNGVVLKDHKSFFVVGIAHAASTSCLVFWKRLLTVRYTRIRKNANQKILNIVDKRFDISRVGCYISLIIFE